MRKFFQFLILLLFVANSVNAQQELPQRINGKVMADCNDLEGIYIINLKTDKSTDTERGGYFSINASVGDTLVFSAVHLKSAKITLKKEDFQKDLFFVNMEILVRRLSEVKIMEYKNINAVALGIIPANTKHFTPAERKLNTASNSYFRGNKDGTSGASVGIDPLINLLSGRTAMLEKQLEVEKKEALLKRINDIFNENYFVNNLKIPSDYVKGFEYYIVENNSFVTAMKSKDRNMTKFVMNDLATKYLALLNTN